MQKKSQITLFIVLGIIIALSAGSYIYFRATMEEVRIEPELIAAKETPIAFNPVEVFVQDCIEDVSEDGIRLLGSQGGYASLERAGMDIGISPTQGSAVALVKGSELKIPYWFYLESDNKCTGKCDFATKLPELYKGVPSSIEAQLEAYIEDNLKVCLNSFSALKSKGYQIE